MRIVHLNTSDFEGGAARSAWRLHAGIRNLGHESAMITGRKVTSDPDVHCIGGEPEPEAARQLAHWAELTESYIHKNRTSLTDCFFSLPVPGYDLALHPMVQAADIIHLHWVAGLLSPQSIDRLQHLGKPVVWTLHDQRPFTGGCHFSFGCRNYETSCAACPQLGDKAPDLTGSVLAQSLEMLDPTLTSVVCPSRWMAASACDSAMFHHTRINIIPYGVDTKTFHPLSRASAREKLGIPPEGIYFLFGADSIRDRRKGFNVLLEALGICREDPVLADAMRLPGSSKSFHGLLKADGSASNRLNFISFGWSSDQFDYSGLPVRGLGHIDSEEKMNLAYAAADLFICPTLEDNLPNAIIESLSCGTPVLASNVGGVPDLITSHRNGLLFERGDARSLAAAIKWITQNKAVLASWSARARQMVEANFTVELQAMRFMELYAGLLKQTIKHDKAMPGIHVEPPLLPATWEIPGRIQEITVANI